MNRKQLMQPTDEAAAERYIQLEAAKIRAGWSERERLSKIADDHDRPRPVDTPVISTLKMIRQDGTRPIWKIEDDEVFW